jgi:small subunit ribosomal protein S9
VVVNGRPGEIYFNRIANYLQSLKAPLETLGLENEYNILVNAHGGGLTGQADAVKLGVARALCQLALENRQPLKAEGYLTRDPRAKERKKYGLHKARKAPQYSKR